MWPSRCWRFSVPTQTRVPSRLTPESPSLMSPTLVYRSPHCEASRLIRFKPSAGPPATPSAARGSGRGYLPSSSRGLASPAAAPAGARAYAVPARCASRRRKGWYSKPLNSSTYTSPTRQFDLERAVDVGVLRLVQLEVGAVVLEPVLVDLVAVAVGRQVATVRRAEVDPGAGTGLPPGPSSTVTCSHVLCGVRISTRTAPSADCAGCPSKAARRGTSRPATPRTASRLAAMSRNSSPRGSAGTVSGYGVSIPAPAGQASGSKAGMAYLRAMTPRSISAGRYDRSAVARGRRVAAHPRRRRAKIVRHAHEFGWQCDAKALQPLVAQRVLAPEVLRDPRNGDFLAGGRLDAQRLQRLVRLGVRQRVEAQRTAIPPDGGLVAPPGVARRRAAEVHWRRRRGWPGGERPPPPRRR